MGIVDLPVEPTDDLGVDAEQPLSVLEGSGVPTSRDSPRLLQEGDVTAINTGNHVGQLVFIVYRFHVLSLLLGT